MTEQDKSGGSISLTPQLEDVLKRICSNSKVEGVVVVNNEGIPIKSTLDSTSTVQARRGREREVSPASLTTDIFLVFRRGLPAGGESQVSGEGPGSHQ